VAELLDGRVAAAALKERLARRVARLREAGVHPRLEMLRVGEDRASVVYMRAKTKAAEEVGVDSATEVLAESADAEDVRAALARRNADPAVHGILLQLPLPAHLPTAELVAAIDPEKDVDGFHPINIGRLCLELPGFLPATPRGVVRLLEHYRVPIAGREVVILGRSATVGRPLANMLSGRGAHGNATVTLCHTRTRDLARVTRGAEILVVAAGQARMVGAEMVAAGATVIDVGIHSEPHPTRPGKRRLCGDVDFAAVAPRAAAITPVPGGVGPMTVACLLENTVEAAERAAFGAGNGDAATTDGQ